MLVAKRSCTEDPYMSVSFSKFYSLGDILPSSTLLSTGYRLPQPVGILFDHYLAPHSVTLFQWMFGTLLPLAISS